MRGKLAGLDSSPAFLEEVAQVTLELLLVGGRAQKPRLSSYDGRAPLPSWMWTVAERIVLILQTRAEMRQNLGLSDAEIDGLVDAFSSDLGVSMRHYLRTPESAWRPTEIFPNGGDPPGQLTFASGRSPVIAGIRVGT